MNAKAIRLQLRSFSVDAAVMARTEALLRAFPGCELETLAARQAERVEATADAALDGAVAATLLLTGSDGVPRACSTVRMLHALRPSTPVLVLTSAVSGDELIRIVGSGADDFATLDSGDDEVRLRLRRMLGLLPSPPVAADESFDIAANAALHALSARLIGKAPAFTRLVRRVPAMAASDATVLLLGETGTGKEVCAHAIHYCSSRCRGPWVAINCAAIPPDLVEDELFGHVRGAYTHAVGARRGLVHEAEGGTLFLDEIDSMPLAAQAKLLRFIQEKQYRAVGASALHTADVRVIAASNRDLRSAAATGTFRSDLYFRLNVLSLTLPPLRSRVEDIQLLAAHFMAEANVECGRHLAGISPAALQVLREHAWPGNVRELKHVLQRAVLLALGPTLQAVDIEIDGELPAEGEPVSFREAKARAVQTFERRYLEQLLAQSEGNISRAARAASKNRRAFFELLRRHAIDATRYRAT